MQKLLCTVLDSKSAIYSAPFSSINRQTAMRDFAHAAQEPNSQMAKFPEDFRLYALGSFDDNTGQITMFDSPEYLIAALDFHKDEL